MPAFLPPGLLAAEPELPPAPRHPSVPVRSAGVWLCNGGRLGQALLEEKARAREGRAPKSCKEGKRRGSTGVRATNATSRTRDQTKNCNWHPFYPFGGYEAGRANACHPLGREEAAGL